ncbi:MAG UNVERIFIED_CONTAM: phosphatidylserine decarboxylase [Planctomycetaceae bacterium]|jgi:phosphatidylserine decarboxylase
MNTLAGLLERSAFFSRSSTYTSIGSPIAGRVIGLRYRPGKYLNALRPESARENEQLAVYIEESGRPHRGMIVRQITGAIARRIVCWLKPADTLSAGEQFGMIKLGSRTELVIPAETGLEIQVRPGDKVKAGTTVLARYTAASGIIP